MTELPNKAVVATATTAFSSLRSGRFFPAVPHFYWNWQQAASNSKEQFANSPDLNSELTNTIIGALDAHTLMSTQASNSPSIQKGLKNILLDHAKLWEALRGNLEK